MSVLDRSSLYSLYARLPPLYQNLFCSFYGWREAQLRYGKEFDRKLEALLQSERWSKSEIEAYTNEHISRLIVHSYTYVPYYREIMRRLRLRPCDIRNRVDLQKLPILTKEDVRRNLSKLRSDVAGKGDLLLRHTSGTTGKSLCFYTSRKAIPFQWAVWWRHRHRFGLHPGMTHVNWTGKMAVPPEQGRPPYWRWNWPSRQALINMHHVTPDKISEIMNFLGSHTFAFYSGYPSIIHALCLAARERGLRLGSCPRVVVTGAENMYEFQRRDIVGLTKAVITDQYGFSEGCGNASECENAVYHEDYEFGCLECVDGEDVGAGAVRGRIVCTGFASEDFPLIRYDIGDVGVWASDEDRCECGRESSRILRIEGRSDDYIVTPEGRRIMRLDYVFKETGNVKECQVVQRRPDRIVVRIVRRMHFNANDEELITSRIGQWISPRLIVEYEYVNEIEREGNGKFRAVKSELCSGRLGTGGTRPVGDFVGRVGPN